MRSNLIRIPILLLALSAPAFAQQLSPSATWAAQAAAQYTVSANVTYRTASNQQLKMDIYYRRGSTPQPTLVYMHGGFWVAGVKETAITALLPWIEAGWNVVNVEYRLGVATDASTLAPAAVDDCFCALRFVASLPANYNIDKNRVVVTGESAGGHLALAMGIIPESAGLGKECTGVAPPPAAGGRGGPAAAPAAAPATPPTLAPVPKIAAVINWFGITDVPDVIDGANRQQAAVRWFTIPGATPNATALMPNAMEIARKVSPLTYVRAGLPPIITIHGDADRTVPYPEAVRLHEALAKVNVPNQLVTIPGGGHGGFTAEERLKIYTTIREFLAKNGLALN